jgi:hypothetical protein
MSPTNALALACLLTCSACSTPSSTRLKPDFVTAQCPPPKVTIDRSFAASPPPCLADRQKAKVTGESWGGALISLGDQVATRDRCLDAVAAWLDSERAARTPGAPGA